MMTATANPMSGPPSAPSLRVVIAVLTFRRPDGLRRALSGVLEQIRSPELRSTPILAATVLVVDNDADASARSVVEPYPDARYVCEPTPGISAARNRAMDEAGDVELLIFLDDDERPREGWLDALVGTWLGYDRPAAVMGPVESVFEREPEAFIRCGRFFARPRLRTGTVIPVAAAGNLLLDLAQVRAAGVRFDERLGLTGGEDTLFSRQLDRSGARMVWCDEAVADDFVPPARTTREWVLRRSWRTGLSSVVTDLYLADSGPGVWAARGRGVGRGSVRVLGGAALYLVGVLSGSMERRANGLRALHRGRGMVAGARGVVYEEYGRTG